MTPPSRNRATSPFEWGGVRLAGQEEPVMTSVLSELPTRLHHNAYVCADQERTRHFYEDIVGLPLVATWIEQGQSPDFPGREISFAHTFFAIGDGGALAFFQFADRRRRRQVQGPAAAVLRPPRAGGQRDDPERDQAAPHRREHSRARTRSRLLQVDLRVRSRRIDGGVHRRSGQCRGDRRLAARDRARLAEAVDGRRPDRQQRLPRRTSDPFRLERSILLV